MPRAPSPSQRCLAELREHGLLMAAGAAPRSVATIVAGEPVKGSWWSHPAGKAIFDVLERLHDHRDVLALKLVDGKVTLVHRTLWPDVLAVATNGAPWQTQWLPRREAELLAHVEEHGRVVVDDGLVEQFDASAKHLGKELEARLLALATSVHTESGAHARVLVSWWAWAVERGVASAAEEDAARVRLETAARSLVPRARLPWTAASVRRKR